MKPRIEEREGEDIVRPTAIHEAPCRHCPSALNAAAGKQDEESADIKAYWPREQQLASCFPCGWRPEKLCKGYCDFLDVTEALLRLAREEHPTDPAGADTKEAR